MLLLLVVPILISACGGRVDRVGMVGPKLNENAVSGWFGRFGGQNTVYIDKYSLLSFLLYLTYPTALTTQKQTTQLCEFFVVVVAAFVARF